MRTLEVWEQDPTGGFQREKRYDARNTGGDLQKPTCQSRCLFRKERQKYQDLCQYGEKNKISPQFQERIYGVINTGIQKFKTDLDNGCIFYT